MKAEGLTGKPGRPSEESASIEEAKLREINLRCRKHELDVAEREGELVPLEDVRRDWSTKVTMAKNKLIGFGAAVVPHLQGRDAPEQQGIIDARITEILNELSGS